jgi:hypothetical protein
MTEQTNFRFQYTNNVVVGRGSANLPARFWSFKIINRNELNRYVNRGYYLTAYSPDEVQGDWNGKADVR